MVINIQNWKCNSSDDQYIWKDEVRMSADLIRDDPTDNQTTCMYRGDEALSLQLY